MSTSVASPSPPAASAALTWLRYNLFSSMTSGAATLVVGVLAGLALLQFINWGVVNAVWRPNFAACRALDYGGACWGVVAEKFRLILFGRYPFDEQWRPMIATPLMIFLIVASCRRGFRGRTLLAAWAIGLAAFFVLMRGGILGLTPVETARWGGSALTLLLTTLGAAAAFPFAVLVALGRRSQLPALRSICVVYVELVRGVPLVSVLFMASFLFPLFMPQGCTIDVLIRVQAGIILFSAAYLAEVVRGGLQSVPLGQLDAAASLGLSYWQTQFCIVLPQALRAVVPAIVNTVIGLLKDTSLVTIVSHNELTGSLQLALADADWRGFYLEGYLFIALIYFVCCLAMSRYSQRIETRLGARLSGAAQRHA
jgi:general L-amino acid transport system permease protein